MCIPRSSPTPATSFRKSCPLVCGRECRSECSWNRSKARSAPFIPMSRFTNHRVSMAAASGDGGVAVAEPFVIHFPAAEITEPFLEIIDAGSGGRIITIIEVVSRSNKAAGEGRKLYLRKQEECKNAAVNLVEIDLLRNGDPVTLAHQHFAPRDRPYPWHTSVWRASRPDQAECYLAGLRERLPVIGVPLRTTDADVPLDLQELIDLCHLPREIRRYRLQPSTRSTVAARRDRLGRESPARK